MVRGGTGMILIIKEVSISKGQLKHFVKQARTGFDMGLLIIIIH